MLSAADILKAGETSIETVTTDLGELRVKVLSFYEQGELAKGDSDDFAQSLRLIQKCLVNEKGEPLFGDVKQLGALKTEVIGQLATACLNANGMGEEPGE